MNQPDHRSPPASRGRVVFGSSLLVLGVILLLDSTGIVGLRVTWRLWPFVLLAIGLARVTDPVSDAARAFGVWLLLIGCWGLVSEFRLFGFEYRSSWPLLIIAAGLAIVWQSFARGDRARPPNQGFPS